MKKNLMEDNQLDFNRPLLSVRRFSSPVARKDAVRGRKVDSSLPKIPSPPAYMSESKSGQIGDPGTVPFLWEQIPGRPKDDRRTKYHPLERPPVVPKLPPGRTVNAKNHDSDTIYKVEKVLQSKTNISRPSCENINVDKDERSSDGLEEKDSYCLDYDEAYLDARQLSIQDGPDMEVSGTFSTDQQTLDIMMGRFLPAAKAMVSESSQHPSRKKHVTAVKLQQPNLLRHHMQNETGLRMQSGALVSSGHRSRIESTCADPLGGTDSLVLARDVVNEQKLKGGHQNHDFHVDKMVYRRDHLKLYGSSLYRRLQDATGVSYYQNNHSGKGPCIFHELLDTDHDKCELPSISSVAEKTLYIDPMSDVLPDDRKIDLEKRMPKSPNVGSTNSIFPQLSLPPLPKSPSESWLQRTLPTLSLKNSSKSSIVTSSDMKYRSSKSPSDPTWETIVKTSNTYHGHLRFSEELLTPIPEA